MSHTFVHEDMLSLLRTFRYDAHPMGMLVSATAALSTQHPDANPALQGNGLFEEQTMVNKQIYRLLGKLPTIAAATWRHRVGRPYNYPESTTADGGGGGGSSWTASFLKLLVSVAAY